MGWWDGDANATTVGNVGEEGEEDSPWPDDLHLLPTYTTTVSTTYTVASNSSSLASSLLYNLTTYANESVSRPKKTFSIIPAPIIPEIAQLENLSISSEQFPSSKFPMTGFHIFLIHDAKTSPKFHSPESQNLQRYPPPLTF